MAIRDLVPFHRTRSAGLERRRPESPIASLHEEMDRLFNRMVTDVFGARDDLGGRDAADWTFMPEVDVKETATEIRVTAELPGVDEKDVDISLDRDVLTIRGEKHRETSDSDESWTRSERMYGSFIRRLPLGSSVDEQRAEATFRNGVLKIRLPKLKDVGEGRKRISVKSS